MESLLKWTIETSAGDGQPPRTQLNSEALAQLFGAKSEADLMREAMEAITDKDETLENKLVAFDNLEMLCEGLDNANNLENLKLWEPLIAQLDSPEADLRFMAAWNNIKTQAKFHATGGTEKVVKAFLNDPVEKVRSKAVYAISSSIRNYEPAFKNTLELLPKELLGEEELHHEEMEGIDRLIQRMREEAKNPR